MDTEIQAEAAKGTAIALPEARSLAVMFRSDGGLDPLIAEIEARVRAHVPDVSTAAGRKAIASLAHTVARSKTALDDAGKRLNEDARAQINAVDAARRKLRDRLDALKDEARKPLDEWEAAEDARVEALKARLDRLSSAAPAEDTSDSIKALIQRVEITAIDDSWQEYLPHAGKAKDATLNRLRAQLATTEQREAEAAELARLRAEAEARAEADRIKAEQEAAEARRIAAEKAQAERLAQIERDKREAAERAAREAEQRAAAEAERVRIETEQKAEAERKAAADRESKMLRERAEAEAQYKRKIAEIAAKAEAAAQAERDRIEAERKAAAEAQAAREADQAHRAKIAADIAAALRTMSGRATPEAIANALINGEIPHIKVML
jgi:hypothetical protein